MSDVGGVTNESENSRLLPDIPRRNTSNHLLDISPIVHETDDSITIRQPVHYLSINNGSQQPVLGNRARATVNRYKYYTKLASHSGSTMLMPNHVVPSEYFLVIPVKQPDGTQSSIVTIFSIWNTMVGTSLLSIPWAMERCGFATGIVILLVMSALTLYTAYRVLQSPQSIGGTDAGVEFSDVCRFYLGRWGEYISVVFSLLTLLGAAVVYWVLMSNFLYSTVKFIYDDVNKEFNTTVPQVIDNMSYDAFCPHPPADGFGNGTHLYLSTDWFSSIESSSNETSSKSLFDQVWSQKLTVPFFLLLILGPLVNIKSPTFFTKFNALGTVSVMYIMVFVAVKASSWGLHLDFNPAHYNMYIPEFQWTFPALTGTLSLAFFIHNCVLSIVKNQRYPENNARDLSIAYMCVAFTYLFIAVTFYSCFPLPKSCIEDNLLNNFRNEDVMAFASRLFLLFQMVTVFPLILYIFRIQLMNAFSLPIYPSWKHVLGLNAVVLSICLFFAVFLPQIGIIIRFSGALCGFVYVFTLPSVIYMMSLKRQGRLTWLSITFHSTVICFGAANFIAQFLIIGRV